MLLKVEEFLCFASYFKERKAACYTSNKYPESPLKIIFSDVLSTL